MVRGTAWYVVGFCCGLVGFWTNPAEAQGPSGKYQEPEEAEALNAWQADTSTPMVEVSQDRPLDEAAIHREIAALKDLAEAEQRQRLPAILSKIVTLPDVSAQNRLGQELSEQVATWGAGGLPLSGVSRDAEDGDERAESASSGLQPGRRSASEEAIRSDIDALNADSEHPERFMLRAMEIAEAIDEVTDATHRQQLRTTLEERVKALQGLPAQEHKP